LTFTTGEPSSSSNSDANNNTEHGAELIVKDSVFKPLYLIGEWEEPGTKTKRLTVAIVLPSGVNKSDFTIQVLDAGLLLQLTVKWPVPLVDLELLHQKWLRPVDKDRKQNESRIQRFWN